MTSASQWVTDTMLIVSAAKEASSSVRITEVLGAVLPDVAEDAIGVLAGPQLAREVIAGHLSAPTIAFTDVRAATAVQRRLTGPTFRVCTSADVVAHEIGAAAKDVIAIRAGVASALGYG
jgi:glycerol-3-phosphate dehydrogenase (NAD(P)+)